MRGYERYTVWPTHAALRWVGAQVAAPLIFDGSLLGFLLPQNAATGGFGERDPDRLMTFAGVQGGQGLDYTDFRYEHNCSWIDGAIDRFCARIGSTQLG